MRGRIEPPEQNLRPKAAVPNVNGGLFRSFLVRIIKKAHGGRNNESKRLLLA
jgi:hypothetical protein